MNLIENSLKSYLRFSTAFHRRRHETRHGAYEEEETSHKERNTVAPRSIIDGTGKWWTDNCGCSSKQYQETERVGQLVQAEKIDQDNRREWDVTSYKKFVWTRVSTMFLILFLNRVSNIGCYWNFICKISFSFQSIWNTYWKVRAKKIPRKKITRKKICEKAFSVNP